MKPYTHLTTRGQALRLRRLAWNALAHYDLDVRRLRLVTNDLNGIFRLDTAAGEKYILRVTLPEGGHTHDHVAAEMDWLAALARDTDLSVPRPLPSYDGRLVVTAAAPGVPQPRLCAVFSWVPGRDLADDFTPANAARLGELMARLHQHALGHHPPRGLDLLRFDRVFPFPEPLVLFDDAYAAFLPPPRRLLFKQSIAWIQASLDALLASGEPPRLLHGDLHQWNVRLSRSRLSPIDFEDLMFGWPVQDIATTLYYFPAETYPEMLTAFHQGYTRRCPWPERAPGEIDSFIAARALGLANFILNDPNPSWNVRAAEFIAGVERRIISLLPRAPGPALLR